MTMTPKQALEELAEVVAGWLPDSGDLQVDAKKALAHLTDMAEDYEKVRAEVQRCYKLLCGARCVYCDEIVSSGAQNQDIADEALRKHVMECPRHPANEFRIRAEKAEAELEKVKAELAHAKKDYDWMMTQHDQWKTCAFKEAELKDGFKAELARWRPLIEAVEKDDQVSTRCAGDILRAALKARGPK